MKRRADEPELMGAQEAARTLGVQQPNLRTVAGLPKAYDRVAATTLWRADEIRALAWKRQQAKQPQRVPAPVGTNTHTEETPA
jgi:hypothetical protein